MVGMFKICDFCGAREEKEFERWGTIVMDGASVKNGHSTMDLCENCMKEFVINTRKMYKAKQSGTVEDLPLFKDNKSKENNKKRSGKQSVNANK